MTVRSANVRVGTVPAEHALGGHGFRLRPSAADLFAPWPVLVEVRDERGAAETFIAWPGEWCALSGRALTVRLWLESGSGVYQLDIGRERDDAVLPAFAVGAGTFLRYESAEGQDFVASPLVCPFRRPPDGSQLSVWIHQPANSMTFTANVYGYTSRGVRTGSILSSGQPVGTSVSATQATTRLLVIMGVPPGSVGTPAALVGTSGVVGGGVEVVIGANKLDAGKMLTVEGMWSP